MTPRRMIFLVALAIAVVGGAGIIGARFKWLTPPWWTSETATPGPGVSQNSTAATDPIIYYRDPDGRPAYAIAPRKRRTAEIICQCMQARRKASRTSRLKRLLPEARRGACASIAIPWACRTLRPFPRRTRWGWITSRSMRTRHKMPRRSRSARGSCKRQGFVPNRSNAGH